MTGLRIFYPAVFLLLLSACGSSGPDTPLTADTGTAKAVMEEILQKNTGLFPFQGSGTLTIETPDQGQRLNCRIYYNSNDTVKMEVNTGFGFGIINLWLTPDSLFISNRLTNQFVSSTYRSDELMTLLHFPFQYQDIQTLFLGRISLAPQMQLVQVLNEGENFVFSYRGPEGSEKIWINRLIKKPARIIRSNRKGTVLLDISFQRYKEVNSDQLAHQIQIYRPDEKEKLSLFFSQITPLQTQSLRIIIPEKMERVQL